MEMFAFVALGSAITGMCVLNAWVSVPQRQTLVKVIWAVLSRARGYTSTERRIETALEMLAAVSFLGWIASIMVKAQ